MLVKLGLKIIILDGLAATIWLLNPLNRRSCVLGAGWADSAHLGLCAPISGRF